MLPAAATRPDGGARPTARYPRRRRGPVGGNRDGGPDDLQGVDCASTAEILSAEMDGEASDAECRSAHAHLRGCADCRAHHSRMIAVTRAVRVAPVQVGPDVAASVLPGLRPRLLDRLRGSRGRSVRTALRILLGVVALLQLAVAVRLLTGNATSVHVDPAAGMPMPHVNHETGAWNAAVAVALGWVALRTRHAGAHLPVLAGFAGVLAGVSAFDLVLDNVGPARLLTHLPVFLGLLLVTGLAVLRSEEGRPRTPVAGRPDDGVVTRTRVTATSGDVPASRSPTPPAAHRRSA